MDYNLEQKDLENLAPHNCPFHCISQLTVGIQNWHVLDAHILFPKMEKLGIYRLPHILQLRVGN